MIPDRNVHINKMCLTLLLLIICFIPIKSAFSQFTCIPTCNTVDSKFLVLAGIDLSTINNTDSLFQFISFPGDESIEIGIFDGDAEDSWDLANPPFAVLEYTLFADPDGDGSGTLQIARWTSDGSSGDNIGSPMPDDDWFVQTITNIPEAQGADQFYSYRLVVSNLNPGAVSLNAFKVRSDGILAIPEGEAFNYISSFGTLEAFGLVFPNVDFTDTQCFDIMRPGVFCDPITDPTCCLIPSNYDGIWDFYFLAPEDLTTLDIWDGDFDYGSSSLDENDQCINPDGVNVDTDDPNTPIPLPPWAIGTDAVTQGVSSPTNPADDFGCQFGTTFPPSINYELINPEGVNYINENPSGNIEWELFNLSTEPFDPTLYDIHVDNILGGLWNLRTFGVDMQNLNSYRVPFGVCALNEQGEPVCPPGEFVLNPVFPALDDNINSVSVENATPNGTVVFTWGKLPASFTVGGNTCSGIELGIANPRIFAIERANEFGVSTYIFYIPTFNNLQFGIQLQAVDIETCRVSNQIEQIIRKDESG